MNKLSVKWLKTANFIGRDMEIYTDGKKLYLTRLQIGEVLGYNHPSETLHKISQKIKTVSAKGVTAMIERPFVPARKMRLYTIKGAMEITAKATSEKARTVYGWLQGLGEGLSYEKELAVVYDETKILTESENSNFQNELSLIRTEDFDGLPCNFYGDSSDIWLTREQVGQALEYSEPSIAITKIHMRHKERLDKFSVYTKLVAADGKPYETCIYSTKGVYEICRWSRQPKADAFFDWVYDVLENLRQGRLAPKPPDRTEKLAAALKEVLTPAEAAKLAAAFTN